ncbi:MAG: ABC transporter substrate-binding protein, partial [Deltaproteobacteria bacterium]|nr:ABC transporter substrate-binding protein [Deltaproteobacteria bacterium]
GFIEIMKGYAKERGLAIQFDLQNAQGDMATSMLIVKKFVADVDSLIFTISTPSTQHAVKATRKIPIIFGAVTDPVSAGIVKNLQHPGGNVTGVSDVWPVKKQVELLLRLVPSVKKLGLVYNPGESNSTFLLQKLQEACDQLGLDLVTRAISNTGEVMMATKNLAPKVDAFFSSIDNTVLSAIASLVKTANQYRKPIIAGESDSVKEGAIATLGTNYYEIGKDSGRLAVKVLEGANPGDLPVISDTKTDLYLNLKAFKFLDIKVASEMEQNAKEIFK